MRLRRVGLGALLLLVLPQQGPADAATAPPSLFGVRLEGFAVRPNIFTTASSVNPGSGYSFAKIDSNPGYEGGRQLEMKTVASNNDPGDLGGAVVFSASSPLNGSNLPGYADAYFPTFEGYSQISEKCVVNTSNREAPECRGQPGPYALAQVVPDQAAPRVVAFARSSGDGEHGQTVTRSEIGADESGAVVAVQDNRGNDQQVPGTPITLDFVATSTMKSTLDGVEASGSCVADIRVGGQQIASPEELQQALGPFTATSGVRVDFVPPSPPAIVETGDGGREVTCTGAQFTVSAAIQGQSGVTYTYGRTFAAASRPDNPSYTGGAGVGEVTAGLVSGLPPPSSESLPFSSPSPTLEPPAAGASSTPSNVPASTATTPSAEADAPSGAAPGGLITRRIDTMPLAAGTALAAMLLPAAVWLLFGVTGSLARGLPRLRLPPFAG